MPVFETGITLVSEYWQDVGIRTSFRQISWELMNEKAAANELQATIRWSREPYWAERLEHDYIPSIYWAPLWVEWYNSNGDEGEEPPEEFKALYDLHEEIMVTVPGTDRDGELYEELYAWYAEYVPWFMMYKGSPIAHYINNRIGNVPNTKAQHHAQWQTRRIEFAYDASRDYTGAE